MILIAFLYKDPSEDEKAVTTSVEQTKEVQKPVSESAIISAPQPVSTPNPEDAVFTFLQGPKSWKENRKWSGKWGEQFMDGGSFGGFGCGLCCMANIYSTLTEYKSSPIDMYDRAKKETFYSGGGAISWEQMRKVMGTIGFEVQLGEKPSTYKRFREIVKKGQAMLVLVSSSNSNAYWKNTPGHYVTIFLYDESTDKVFLADSGDPEHNRSWVPLKTIYKSLKTSSDFQYLAVNSYKASKDTWKHKKINGTWVH